MSSILKMIIISNKKEVIDFLYDDFSKSNYFIIKAVDGKTALSLIQKNKPHLAFIDSDILDMTSVDLLLKISDISPSTEPIIISKEPIENTIKQFSKSNRSFAILEKPIDSSKLHLIIDQFVKRNKVQIETKATLDDLFASYNQLEFLITILMNEFESNSKSLRKTIDKFETTKLTQEQNNSLFLLKGIFHNNDRMISRFHNMRSILEISGDGFRKIDLVKLVLDAKKELNLHSGCQVFLSDNFNVGEYFASGTEEGMKILVNEVLHSLTIPMTNLCKKLEINLELSDENLPNSYEIEVRSIIHRSEDIDDDSVFNPSTQQYGFGYFLIKNLIDVYNGKLLLEDMLKDEYIETKMVIILPKYEK